MPLGTSYFWKLMPKETLEGGKQAALTEVTRTERVLTATVPMVRGVAHRQANRRGKRRSLRNRYKICLTIRLNRRKDIGKSVLPGANTSRTSGRQNRSQ